MPQVDDREPCPDPPEDRAVQFGFDGASRNGQVWIAPTITDPPGVEWLDVGHTSVDGITWTPDHDPIEDLRRFAALPHGCATDLDGLQIAGLRAQTLRDLRRTMDGIDLAGAVGAAAERRAMDAVDPDGAARQARDARRAARREHSGRRAAEQAPAAGDVIAAIDAAVEEKCSCGCGRQIRDDGPSAYFATQRCQAIWMDRQVTDPGDVYERDDANGANIDPDAPGARRDMNRPVRAGSVRAGVDAATRLMSYLQERDEEQRLREGIFNWRRWCPNCRQRDEPRNVGEQVDVTEFGRNELIGSVHPNPHQACGSCGYAWPGPLIEVETMHDYTHERGYVNLRMRAGDRTVGMSLSIEHLERVCDRASYVDSAWDSMERELLQSADARLRDMQRRQERWQRDWGDVMRFGLSFSAQVTPPGSTYRISDT